MRETFQSTLWYATAPPAPETPTLDDDARSDVAVVGGGFMGASLTLHLAENGVDVRLIEAGEPGFGASGRSTGCVVSSFATGTGPAEARKLLGDERGNRLSRMIGGGGDLVFDLARRHRILCDAEQTGWLNPTHTPSKISFLEAHRARWMELDHPLHMLDRAETLRLSGSPGYFAALLDPTGGQINPLAYVRGLIGAAQAAGAVVYGHSPVVRYERVSGAWRLFTAQGSVTAEHVYFTTNALIGNLIPEVARSQIPVTVYQIATEVLGEADRQAILPERHCLSDLRRQRVAYRWSACNRLLTGGVMAIKVGTSKRMPKHYLARLRHVLPGRGPFRAAYAWQGVVGVTRDFLPRLMDLGSGMYAALACNGRGITMATAFGRMLAQFAVDGREADLPVPVTRPNPIPLHGIIRHGPSLWLPWSRVQDWCEERLGAR